MNKLRGIEGNGLSYDRDRVKMVSYMGRDESRRPNHTLSDLNPVVPIMANPLHQTMGVSKGLLIKLNKSNRKGGQQYCGKRGSDILIRVRKGYYQSAPKITREGEDDGKVNPMDDSTMVAYTSFETQTDKKREDK